MSESGISGRTLNGGASFLSPICTGGTFLDLTDPTEVVGVVWGVGIVAFSFSASALRLSTSSDLAFSTSCSTVRPDLNVHIHNVKESGK